MVMQAACHCTATPDLHASFPDDGYTSLLDEVAMVPQDGKAIAVKLNVAGNRSL